VLLHRRAISTQALHPATVLPLQRYLEVESRAASGECSRPHGRIPRRPSFAKSEFVKSPSKQAFNSDIRPAHLEGIAPNETSTRAARLPFSFTYTSGFKRIPIAETLYIAIEPKLTYRIDRAVTLHSVYCYFTLMLVKLTLQLHCIPLIAL